MRRSAFNLDEFPRWLRFSIVGGIGFVVDAGILVILVHIFGLDAIKARTVSFVAAVWVTWRLNAKVTFKDLRNDSTPKFYRYLMVSILGLGLNFGTYTALIAMSVLMARYPVIAVAWSSLLAALFNYWGSLKFTFSPRLSKG